MPHTLFELLPCLGITWRTMFLTHWVKIVHAIRVKPLTYPKLSLWKYWPMFSLWYPCHSYVESIAYMQASRSLSAINLTCVQKKMILILRSSCYYMSQSIRIKIITTSIDKLLLIADRCWVHVHITAGIREVIHTSIGCQDTKDLLQHACLGIVLGSVSMAIQQCQVTTVL